MIRRVIAGLVFLAAAAMAGPTVPTLGARQSTSVDASLLTFASWRHLGPTVAGRATAAAASPAQPGVYLVGLDGAGLWRTSDFGQTWTLALDPAPAGAVGAIAIASSSPNIVYAGTGDMSGAVPSPGSGLYRSVDAGRTFASTGVTGSHPILSIAIDPTDSDLVLFSVGALPGPGEREPGLYRSTDGGRTAQRVAFGTPRMTIGDLAFDRSAPATVFATVQDGIPDGSGVFKSADRGATWRRVSAGLPPSAGLVPPAIALGLSGRLFALVRTSMSSANLYTSLDGGEAWQMTNGAIAVSGDRRPALAIRGDTVFVTTTDAILRSTDAGRTFAEWRTWAAGASSLSLWLHPSSSAEALVASERGVAITVNGGESWSVQQSLIGGEASRLAVDAAFPYRVCGLVGREGVTCAPSRGGTPTEGWTSLGRDILGPIAPDPLDAEVLYTERLFRFDRRTGQQVLAGPSVADHFRTGALESAVLAHSADGRILYAGLRSVWRLTTVGQIWTELSADLVGDADGRITKVAASPIDSRTLWAGTSNGRLHVTRDGGTAWSTVAPAASSPEAVVGLEVSRFDPNTAYATVSTSTASTRLLRTRDGGATWTDIGRTLPAGAFVRAVREDPFRRGLLFAGTDRSVFFSIDDGDTWQSLKQNLPHTRVTDLVIRDADVVIATAGRGFWVLDDFSPLREITPDVARADSFLFRPAQTWRWRAATSSVESAGGEGVALSYLVGPTHAGPLTIEIIETITGDLIRRYSSDPERQQAGDPLLARTPGLHRVTWDMRYTRPEADASAPGGARVLPGTYQVRLTTGARTIRQAVAVRQDPRVRAAAADLTAQRTLARALDARRAEIARAIDTRGQAAALVAVRDELRRVARAVQDADARPSAALEAAAAGALDRAAAALASASPR